MNLPLNVCPSPVQGDETESIVYHSCSVSFMDIEVEIERVLVVILVISYDAFSDLKYSTVDCFIEEVYHRVIKERTKDEFENWNCVLCVTCFKGFNWLLSKAMMVVCLLMLISAAVGLVINLLP